MCLQVEQEVFKHIEEKQEYQVRNEIYCHLTYMNKK